MNTNERLKKLEGAITTLQNQNNEQTVVINKLSESINNQVKINSTHYNWIEKISRTLIGFNQGIS